MKITLDANFLFYWNIFVHSILCPLIRAGHHIIATCAIYSSTERDWHNVQYIFYVFQIHFFFQARGTSLHNFFQFFNNVCQHSSELLIYNVWMSEARFSLSFLEKFEDKSNCPTSVTFIRLLIDFCNQTRCFYRNLSLIFTKRFVR